MKQLIVLLLLLVGSITAIAQPTGTYSKSYIYGTAMKRLMVDSSFHLPKAELGDSILYNLYNVNGAIAITDTTGQIIFSTDSVTYNQRVLDLRDSTWIKGLKGRQAFVLTVDSLESDQVTYINPELDGIDYMVFRNQLGRYLDADEWDYISGGGFELEDSLFDGDKIILIGEIRFSSSGGGTVSGQGILTYETLEDLQDDETQDDNTVALVFDDADPSYNGFYRWDNQDNIWVKITYIDLPGNDIDLFEQD